MVARAEAAERTTEKIFSAALELFRDRPFSEVTVQAITDRAGVSLQTVLRKFGSKEGLFEAVGQEMLRTVMTSRRPATSDVRVAVETLVASYETMGDVGWRGLCEEGQFPWLKQQMDKARAAHREWVEQSFAHLLPAQPKAERDRVILLLFAATDFYLWKLFRRDLGLGRQATTERMIDLVNNVVRGLRDE
ncbi:MAG: helix-turn-helix domain-containing protein [Myxococcota bacterium]